MSNTTAKAIRSIRPDQRTLLPGPPGAPFRREEYVGDGHVWVGMVTTEPDACSPWHHHGEHETYVYVLEGEATVELADGQRITAIPDGSLHIVPGGLPHREINTGTVPNKMLIMRVGEGPNVIPVEV